MDAECKKAEDQISRLQAGILEQSGRKEQIRRCLDKLRQCGDVLAEFDPGLWNSMVESVTVHSDKTLMFRFRDETEIPVKMSENQQKVPYNDAE